MKKTVEGALRASLMRLQKTIQQFEAARKYNRELAHIKALQELVREQTTNEDSHSTVSQTR